MINGKTDSLTNIKELYRALHGTKKDKIPETDKIQNPTESPIYPMSGT